MVGLIPTEEWRIWRVGDYEVSNLGRVRRATTGRKTWVGRLLKSNRLKNGYLAVNPVIDGRNVTHYIHLMVAECFIGPCQESMEVNHVDGNKGNPVASNLEYVTHAENMNHALRSGLLATGNRHPGCKISDEQVDEIRSRHRIGEGVCALARHFKVAPSTISQIVNGQRRNRCRQK